MDQGFDKRQPLSTSYRETFRRHRKLFCVPIILGGLAAAVFLMFGAAKTYKSTANLWVDTAPPVPSSVGASSSPLAEPPASAAGGILSELLATRGFAASVAQTSLLGKSLGSADAIQALGNGQVVQAVPGGQVLQISYSASSPALAESVLGAVIAQLRNYTDRLTAQHDRAAVAYNAEQVKAAQTALATARSNVTAYRSHHPGVSQTDPNYVSLIAAESNAETQLAQANTALSQATGTGDSGSWSIRVIDPPSQASTAPLKKKKMAEVILAGVFGGLLVSFLAVVALTPAKKEEWEDELPKKEVWDDELPIGGPLFPDVPTAVRQPRLSLDDRPFEFRTASAPTEEQ